MTMFWRSMGSIGFSASPPLGSVVLESLLATDSVMRVRGGSGAAVAGGSWAAPFNCASEYKFAATLVVLGLLTRLRLREGVASGVSGSDCCWASLRERRLLRVDMVHAGG